MVVADADARCTAALRRLGDPGGKLRCGALYFIRFFSGQGSNQSELLRVMRSASLKVALAVGGITVAFGLLEVAVRLVAPQTMGPAIFEPDTGGSGIWRLKANFDARIIGPEYDIRIRLNAKGLRDVERDYRKPQGVRRILVVGDSFTMGDGVNLEETYVKRVEQALNARDDVIRYDVINAGVQNWGTGEQLIFLKDEWLLYEPDVVLLAFQNTDVTDNVRHKFWELRAGDLIRLSGHQSERAMASFVSRVPGYKWAITHSHAAAYARNSLFTLLYVREYSENHNSPINGRSAEVDAADYPYRLTAELLAEMHRVVAERGIPFMMAYIPNREEVEEYQRNPEPNFYEKFLLEFAKKRLVPFITLVPVLAGAGKILDLYYPRDGHWTAKAHQIASEEIVKFIQAQEVVHKKKAESFAR